MPGIANRPDASGRIIVAVSAQHLLGASRLADADQLLAADPALAPRRRSGRGVLERPRRVASQVRVRARVQVLSRKSCSASAVLRRSPCARRRDPRGGLPAASAPAARDRESRRQLRFAKHSSGDGERVDRVRLANRTSDLPGTCRHPRAEPLPGCQQRALEATIDVAPVSDARHSSLLWAAIPCAQTRGSSWPSSVPGTVSSPRS